MSRPKHHVSASQITTFRSCKRLWAAEKLAELVQPKAETGALATGTEVHAMLEEYLLTGRYPGPDHEHRTKFDAVVGQLPPPKLPGMLVEHEFEFEVYPGGPIMVGGIDIALPPWQTGRDCDGTMVDLWFAGVDDHKTTSDMKYAKTPDMLAVNTQLIIYAYYLFRLPALVGWNILPPEWRPVWEGGLDRIRLRHNYIKTKNVVRKGDSKQVEVEVTWEQVAKEWAGIVADVKEMEALGDRLWDDLHAIQNEPARLDLLIQEVEGDTTAERCHMYQGCDHKGRCPEANALNALVQCDTTFNNLFQLGTTKGESMETNPGTNQVDELAARLQAKMAARAKTAPGAAPAPQPTAAPASTTQVMAPYQHTTPPPGDLGVEGYKKGQPCNGRGWYASSNGQGFIPVEKDHKCPACAHREGQPEVTPPDAPPPEVSPADLAQPPAGPNPTSEAAPPEPGETAPKKRGRKPKAAPTTAPEAPASPATPPAEAPQASTTPAVETQPSASASAPQEVTVTIQRTEVAAEDPDRFAASLAPAAGPPASRIYINCRPLVGGDVTAVDPLAFHQWMGKVHARLVEELKLPHYKLAKFGAGPGALAVVMRALFDQLPAVLYVSTSHPEAQDFLDIALARPGITVIGEVR